MKLARPGSKVLVEGKDFLLKSDDSLSIDDEVGSTHIDSDFKMSPVSSDFGCSDESYLPAPTSQDREGERHNYFLRSKGGTE